MNIAAEQETAIVANRVTEARRLDFLPRYFGKRVWEGEALVYATLNSLCSDYDRKSAGTWLVIR
jgi:hypothetical protein